MWDDTGTSAGEMEYVRGGLISGITTDGMAEYASSSVRCAVHLQVPGAEHVGSTVMA